MIKDGSLATGQSPGGSTRASVLQVKSLQRKQTRYQSQSQHASATVEASFLLAATAHDAFLHTVLLSLYNTASMY